MLYYMLTHSTPQHSPSSQSSTGNAYLRLHLAVLIAGGTGLFGRLITVGELPLVCLRVIMGAAFLAAVMALQDLMSGKDPARGSRLHRLPRRELLMIMGCGVLLSVHWVFYYGSIKAANVSIGAVCFALVGFFTAVIEPLIDRRPPSWREIALGLLTVVGIGLIFGFDARHRIGIGLGIVSSVLYTFFSISSKRVQTSTGRSSSTMLLYELIGGAIVLSLVVPLYSAAFPDVAVVPTTRDWVMLVVFATVFTVVPFLLQLQALRHISAFTVNLTYNLEPVYTILAAMLLFDEAAELNFSFYLGITLIVIAVALRGKK